MFDLLDRAKPCFVPVDHHRQDDQAVSSFADIYFEGHTTLDKAHLSRWTSERLAKPAPGFFSEP
ncbi:hypothetical protein E4Q23_06535 [Candidatus Accumulibacter phosphatis]|uniref:Mobile element protein n=1 Tax=Candidatus Accumulibacter phosphatis TaxID=327160 RepID=A0ABX1TW18_9PROT|nr:hypothetical protein [Candidatus Accumulibacter phosphatis]NMQ27443.1 hypothetical protein [Candidatus Accumulibacter phosphatis]